MIWCYTIPKEEGTYLVETTTPMGKHNTMRAKLSFNKGKPSWSFNNQVFWRYLDESIPSDKEE